MPGVTDADHQPDMLLHCSRIREYCIDIFAALAQLVEHMLDVHGVTGSSPVPRTKIPTAERLPGFFFSPLTPDFPGAIIGGEVNASWNDT